MPLPPSPLLPSLPSPPSFLRKKNKTYQSFIMEMERRNFKLLDFTSTHCLANRLNLGFGIYFKFDDHVRRIVHIGYKSRDYKRRRLSLTLKEFRKFKELWRRAYKTVKRIHKNYQDGEHPGDASETTYTDDQFTRSTSVHTDTLGVSFLRTSSTRRGLLWILRNVFVSPKFFPNLITESSKICTGRESICSTGIRGGSSRFGTLHRAIPR